jgi:hypothetical protein
MSEYIIKSLSTIAENILTVINKIFDHIIKGIQTLEQIPDLIKSIGDLIVKGFNDLIQSQGEMEIQIRLANIDAKKELVLSEIQAVEDFKKQLRDDLDEVSQRYKNIQNDLNKESIKRVAELDQHLLELNEKFFPKDMSDGYNKKIIPFFECFYNDTMNSIKERKNIFLEHSNPFLEKMEKFRVERLGFFDQIESFIINDESLKSGATKYLPLWLVEIEDLDNNIIDKHAFLPGEEISDKYDDFFERRIIRKINNSLSKNLNDKQVINNLFDYFEWEEQKDFDREIIKGVENVLQENDVKVKTQKIILEAIDHLVKNNNILGIKGVKNETNKNRQ